ncbi:L-serine dehydratase, iron-sulfur-dependent, beta subunit [Desulfitobacterium dichloroeliminans LMG P-21439]|uniref:L-serine deaminase n=1 Tax=Desulfitobacterium dichloroeliminans (strain LMG P-21439 / DCA1) TaxID=871963 RepID=L0FAA2_DESDL|nr:L-serine ammonia-lyase, iron-sulfur-dependent subunit beta [Desulfitobacterium dichloroeliminans]AGA70137.1 L-serine dehydratase, iron-sulfur-dependent, beta subunit [Desulfitobacterium dichloroeliminans LMG P-21439]
MGRSTVFDLIGPIMVGPSSSHTAGAVRLGAMARKIYGGQPQEAVLTLHGSFAETGKGHGTNLALIAGLLGMRTDDERIPQAQDIADEQGLSIRFRTEDLGDVHPNTVKISLKAGEGHEVVVMGSSIGGGRIKIQGINEFKVEIMGDYHTLVVLQNDLPGVVAQVTSLIATTQINIAQMRVSREKKGAHALMIIETDQAIDPAALALINKLPAVNEAMAIEPLE